MLLKILQQKSMLLDTVLLYALQDTDCVLRHAHFGKN